MQSKFFSLVPAVKRVFIPAFLRMRLSLYAMPPGMNGMRAKGFRSSSLSSVSLNGRMSNRLSGMVSVVLFFCFLFLLFSVLDWRVGGV